MNFGLRVQEGAFFEYTETLWGISELSWVLASPPTLIQLPELFPGYQRLAIRTPLCSVICVYDAQN